MKNFVLFVFVITLFFSCKKEEKYNPDEHITYAHWYKTRSNPLDTLFSVYIPNAFTPNDDANNDRFYPLGYFYLKSLKVFGKDGNVIYQTGQIQAGLVYKWDGTNNNSGLVVQQGVYVYKLEVADAFGAWYEYNGSLMLRR